MDSSNLPAIGFLWYVIFLLSTVLHEAAHALAARLGGDDTAESQVTLDPIPHIRREPMGMVLVPLITFATMGWTMGWASTPYDPMWAERNPRRAALMALCGPLANLLLVIVAAVIIHVGMAQGAFASPSHCNFTQVVASADGQSTPLTMMLSVTFSLNVLLFVFNLLPLPPLDGSSAVTLLMSENLARRWNELTRQPMLAMVTMVLAWTAFGSVAGWFFRIALNLLYPDAHYI